MLTSSILGEFHGIEGLHTFSGAVGFEDSGNVGVDEDMQVWPTEILRSKKRGFRAASSAVMNR